MPQIGGLLVGFNFGAWELWNISAVNSRGVPISLEYSSAYVNEALPVVGKGTSQPGLRLVPSGNFFLALNRSYHFLSKKVRIQ